MSFFLTHHLFLHSIPIISVLLTASDKSPTEIDKKQPFATTCSSRIEPLQELFAKHRLGKVTRIDVYVTPLPALRFMAGDSVSKLYLYGIEVLVASHLDIASSLIADMNIILLHLFE